MNSDNTDLVLHDLVAKWKWNQLIQRCHRHPTEARLEARQTDERGYLALHWIACSRAAPDTALQSLADVYPEGLLHQNNNGWTPLHVACWRGVYDHVVAHLLRLNVEAAWTLDSRGRLPLHSACMYADTVPVGTVRQLLLHMMVDGTRNGLEMSVLRRDRCGDTAITLLSYAYRRTLEEWRRGNMELDESMKVSMLNYYDKMSMLVTAACLGTVAPSDDVKAGFSLVHGAISVPETIDSAFFELALKMPENVSKWQKLDSNGRLPLHIAAGRQFPYVPNEMRYSRFDRAFRTANEAEIIDLLVDYHKSSAQVRDAAGFFPFDLAIENGKTLNQGVRSILIANPSALEARSIDVRFYPCILESLARHDSLDGTFELLRSKPNLVIGIDSDQKKPQGFISRMMYSLSRCK